MKRALTFIGILLPVFLYGRTDNDSVQVIAKLLFPGQGSKIYVAEYEIIKLIEGTEPRDTIEVAYYFYKKYESAPDTALLHLLKSPNATVGNSYYTFPDYDAKKGIEKVELSCVDFDYWEACETGIGECKPLTFSRKNPKDNWFLILPCGGIFSTYILSEQQGVPNASQIIQQVEVAHSDCPPVFELTNLKDGRYYATIISCGLGGQIEFNIRTEEE